MEKQHISTIIPARFEKKFHNLAISIKEVKVLKKKSKKVFLDKKKKKK